jgi:hypothetical protein
MKRHTVAALTALWLLAGCGGTPAAKTGAPEWIYNPGMSGKLGGVGSAIMHVKGRAAQRELAISRALDEIARQMGVKVSNVLSTQASASEAGASSAMQSYSFQTTDGTTVKAQIKAIWHDSYRDELFVWMVVE